MTADDYDKVRPPIGDGSDRWKTPENQVPVTVPFHIVLARTDDLAIFVQDARVYLAAVELRLTVLFRAAQAEPLAAPSPIRSGMIIGIEYSDGRRTVLGVPVPVPVPAPPGPDEPVLFMTGAAASHRRCDLDLLLTPIPPPGPLTIEFTARAHGIGELATTADAAPLAHAARYAVQLWPSTPALGFSLRPSPNLGDPPTSGFGG